MSRRRALSGVATVGLSLPLLSACGDDESSTAPSDAATSSSSAPAEPAADGIAATGDVPLGGGVVVADEEVVVTQPKAGEFKVFTAVCTHSGCLVGDVTDTINCPCHGSTYDLTTGESTGGPAPSALDPVGFEISGDQVVLT